MDYYLGYRYFDKHGHGAHAASGSFPFGYGLSYSTFSYSNLRSRAATVAKDGVVNVTVDVTNTGTVRRRRDRAPVRLVPGLDGPTRAGRYKELKGYRADRGDHRAGQHGARADPVAGEGPQVLGRVGGLEGRVAEW